MSTEATGEPMPPTAPVPLSIWYDGTMPISPALEALGIPHDRPVLVLVGWADTSLDDDTLDAVDLLLRNVVVPVCRDEGVVIVSGGTDSGIMAGIGRAVSEQKPKVVLVGVAPEAKLAGLGAKRSDRDATAPEPSHRIVRTPGQSWGDEGPFLVSVAEQIAGKRGVVLLAIGGGQGTRREIALAARRKWPVLLTTGHGGTSDATHSELSVPSLASGRRPASPLGEDIATTDGPTNESSAVVREVQDLTDARRVGNLVAVSLTDRPAVERTLRWQFSGNELLKEAWARFATSDHLATSRKRPTTTMAFSVLALATLTVICAVATAWLRTRPSFASPWATNASDALKGLVTALPLAAAGLLGIIDRRSRTGSWIDLRAAAESTIREIYRFRASAGTYASAGVESGRLLGEVLARIDTRTQGWSLVRRTARVGPANYWPPDELWERIPTCDTLVGPLTAESYDRGRVIDQLTHFERAARDLDRHSTHLATLIFVAGGVAALLLAISWKWLSLTAWAAVVASVAAALVSWREYKQRDTRIEAMLSTCIAVREARARWLALTPEDRNDASKIAAFVGEVEDALATEGSDWERGLRQAERSFLEHRKGR